MDKAEGIEKSLEVLEAYHLLRDDLESLSELSLWPGAKNPAVLVDSKVWYSFYEFCDFFNACMQAFTAQAWPDTSRCGLQTTMNSSITTYIPVSLMGTPCETI